RCGRLRARRRVAPPRPEARTVAKNVPQRLRADERGAILLLLTDSAERAAAEQWLDEAGFEVLAVDDAAAARAAIGSRLDLEVAVLDHRLAREGGLFDAARRSPAGLELVLAGPADVFDVTSALAEGAVAF